MDVDDVETMGEAAEVNVVGVDDMNISLLGAAGGGDAEGEDAEGAYAQVNVSLGGDSVGEAEAGGDKNDDGKFINGQVLLPS